MDEKKKPDIPEEKKFLLMGYVDGQLSSAEQARAEELIRTDPEFAEEIRKFRLLATEMDDMKLREPPDEIWENYWNGVYNRLERGGGWLAIIIGAIIVIVFGIYEFTRSPELSIIWKVGGLALIVGFAILLISVIRERIQASKTDKYKDIIR